MKKPSDSRLSVRTVGAGGDRPFPDGDDALELRPPLRDCFLPPNFSVYHSLVPGRLTVRRIPLVPAVTFAPRGPSDSDPPRLLRLSVSPGASRTSPIKLLGNQTPLRFGYESTGQVTRFTDHHDPLTSASQTRRSHGVGGV
ncbi:MAG: hypothetical protein WD294_04790 [Phycisphaeraceae bacterium]